MIKIKPFKGVIYNRDRVKDLTKVLTPPYDVISPQEQDRYYRSSPHNIIRIVLGKDCPGDSARNNKYIRARNFFNSWLKKKILVRDTKPSIYIYEQSFSIQHSAISTRRFSRVGFLALLRLEPFGKSIFPHEETFPKHKKDRAKLLRACRANFNPIFSLYSPESKTIETVIKAKLKEKPLASIHFKGALNRLWRIESEKEIKKIVQEMKKSKVFIADGHHRYETALEYAREMQSRNPAHGDDESYNFVMMMFVKLNDPGLEILPTHRLLKTSVKCQVKEVSRHGESPRATSVRDKIDEYFNVKTFGLLREMFKVLYRMKYSFGMYRGNGKYCVLSVKNMKEVERRFETDIPGCWRQLDMVILHHFFFKHILQIEPTPQDTIKYTTNPKEAVKLVDKDEYQIAFFLNSIKPRVVREIALSGEKMPHKATYFYPKPLSGLVINKM